MPTSAQILAKFAADLTYAQLPQNVVDRAKDCIIDTIAVATYGAQFPWSRMIGNYASLYGKGGSCSVIGSTDRVHAPYAALANGVFTNAFEQDNARYPGVGAHCGATLLPAVLAMCEETGADGKTAITAFVAGCEVLFRIAGTSHHSRLSIEHLGFHGPGCSGPYGAAVAAACVLGLNAEQQAHALGIAGSLSAGILALTSSKQGGMVKRLHLGRTAEAGILAAQLASSGYTGPETVLEGKFGYLEAYCRDADPSLLTKDLGKDWETLRISMKRYPFHGVSQTSVQALRELMAEHKFTGADAAKVIIEGDKKLMTHHNITEPNDIVQAQYSVPFCLALSLFRDPDDPRSLDESALTDGTIREACHNVVELRAHPQSTRALNTRITIKLKDGREFARDANSYKGRPTDPLTRTDLRRKFLMFSAPSQQDKAARLYERLENLEAQSRFTLE